MKYKFLSIEQYSSPASCKVNTMLTCEHFQNQIETQKQQK